jgi:DNA-binding NtrC family response regulator
MSAASPAFAIDRQGKVLVASSRTEFRAKVMKGLAPEVLPATEAAGGADALNKLEEGEFRTLVLDRQIQDLDVEELVATIRARYPRLHVVMPEREAKDEQLSLPWSGSRSDAAAQCGHGAQRSPVVEGVPAAWGHLSDDAPEVSDAPATRIESFPGMIGASRKMQQVYHLARLVAPRDTTVLIAGASGTGKELVARGIHELSRRSRGPFVVVNCAAIPESLFEAELFGFARGAFTGAVQSRLGRIHAAHGGTLLLDEVSELPLSMQGKLLRFAQDGEVQRLGSADLFRVNVRVIAATNADLLQRVREKLFREDLYYRLAVFPLELPPLRSRPEDVLALAQHFLDGFCRQGGARQKFFSPLATNLLRKHSWPGNVRELQHSVERAFVLANDNDQIRAEDLSMPLEAV